MGHRWYGPPWGRGERGLYCFAVGHRWCGNIVVTGGGGGVYCLPFYNVVLYFILILTHTHTHTQYLADIEEHLGVTIPEVSNTFEVPVDEYDGKITYGEKMRGKGPAYEGHVAQLAPSVARLTKMEKLAQTTFLSTQLGKQKWFL